MYGYFCVPYDLCYITVRDYTGTKIGPLSSWSLCVRVARRRLGVHGAAAATERLCAGEYTRGGRTPLFCRDGGSGEALPC